MIIIIDGYNLLKQRFFAQEISEKQRNAFIAQVGIYAKRKAHKIVVVFDGGPYEWANKERMSGVYVVYSGTNETADEYIKRYLDQHRAQDLLLVSSDRELNVHASHLDIPSIGSHDFYQLLLEAVREKKGEIVAPEGTIKKLHESESEELDALMEQASEKVPLKAEDMLVQKEVKITKGRHKLSKKERKLLKKLKKL